jgi:hypothetical protein
MRKKMLKVTFVIVAACIAVTSCAILPPEWSMTTEQRSVARKLEFRINAVETAKRLAISLNDNSRISDEQLRFMLDKLSKSGNELEEAKRELYHPTYKRNPDPSKLDLTGLEVLVAEDAITKFDKVIGSICAEFKSISFCERFFEAVKKDEKERASNRPNILPSHSAPANQLNSCTIGCNAVSNGVCKSYALICP